MRNCVETRIFDRWKIQDLDPQPQQFYRTLPDTGSLWRIDKSDVFHVVSLPTGANYLVDSATFITIRVFLRQM